MTLKTWILNVSLLATLALSNTSAFANPDCWVKLYVREDLEGIDR